MNSFWGQFNLVNDTSDGFAVSFDTGGRTASAASQGAIPRLQARSSGGGGRSGGSGGDWGKWGFVGGEGAVSGSEEQKVPALAAEQSVPNPAYGLPVSRLYHTLQTTTAGTPSPPATTVFCMRFDGGANPNPGPASSGAIVYTPDRRPICERGVYHRRATNNMAEYGGLLVGLTLARSLGIRTLIIEGDSQLVVRQMTGHYKVRDQELLQNWRKAKELVREFDYVGIRHVYREDNTEADRITKDVLIRGESYERFYAAAANFNLRSSG